uniref:Polypyrimidine tract-binding protein isogeny 3 n=1 Tax=Cajanus cajan TaxID=3821 RepID=A0A151S711_CAJCA|nr:Polypyrimidine tract-binding protein isogeny 3 [Cajanus cajan]
MTEPSKVIHVRNVGHEISENDLLQLFQPFGVITKLVMLRAKNQALVQMQDVPSAVNALQFYANIQPSIRGRNVYVQFSSHQELTTMDQSQGRGEEPNRILLVTIHHMLYPITVDVLYQVFSPHGSVEKIVTFQKSAGGQKKEMERKRERGKNIMGEVRETEKSKNCALHLYYHYSSLTKIQSSCFIYRQLPISFQALIQYQSHQSAVMARSTLQGRNIYDGCCQLDIQFSNLDELQVNYNNDRSRDFTNPNLPTEQKGRPSQPGYGDGGNMYAAQGSGARTAGFPQMGNSAAIAAAFGGGLPPGITGTNDRCTILVSNLNPDRIDEEKLFNLFSIYGNIVRIKLLRNKPDHALIQMGDGFQAELAVHFLKGAMLFEKRLEVNFSKHPNITQGADTHEYVNSNLNRFNRNAAKNYRYCCSPTKMIHLSTLPQDITEEEIVSLVEEHGTITNSKVFEMNGKKQALVQFENEEQATEALVCKHASTLSGSVIRISFSQLQNI